MTPEELFKNLETFKQDKASLSQFLASAVKLTFIRKFSEGFDRPFNEEDFSSTKKICESHITYIKLIIENLADFTNQNFKKSINYQSYPDADNQLLALILVMCGENVTVQPWNNEIIVKQCQFVLSTILKIFNCDGISQLISKDHNENLVSEVLNLLTPNLLSSTWKYFPASVVCYRWFLFMIKQPTLSSYLQSVLPPALLLVDDFITENKIIGVECMNHIIQNVPTAELQFYGFGDLIYSALLPHIRIREANLLYNSIPLIILLANKLEYNFRYKNKTKWSKLDDILEILLENMELEQLIELRSCYISHLGLIIDNLKHRIVRWSKRLLRIFDEYIQIASKYNDEKSMSFCIEAIEKYIMFSAELIALYDKKLLHMMVVALISTYNSSSQCIRCVKLILKSMPRASFEDFLLEFNENIKIKKAYPKFYEEFKNVIEEHSKNLGDNNSGNISFEKS